MSKNLKTQWRVQVRRSRAHKWVNKGLFETRSAARESAVGLRAYRIVRENNHMKALVDGYGFGNTRVIKYVKGAK